MAECEQGVLVVQRIRAGYEHCVNSGRGAELLRSREHMRDVEMLCVFPGALLVAAPDAGELRVLCLIESRSKTALTVMPEAKNSVSHHAALS